MPKTKANPFHRALAILLTAALTLTAAIVFAPIQASAASASSLATELNGWNGGGTGSLYASSSGNTVTVTGTVSNTTNNLAGSLTLIIDAGVTVRWRANLTTSNYLGALSIYGPGDFVVESGSITNNYSGATGIFQQSGRLIVSGGTISGSGDSAHSTIYIQQGCTTLISGGNISNQSTSAESVITAGSDSVAVITGGTISAASSTRPALYRNGSGTPSVIVYTSSATITGTKTVAASARGLIAEITAAEPLPQANVGTTTGITAAANGTPAATFQWVNNGNRADVEVAFTGGSGPVTLTVPLRWAIANVTPAISIDTQPTATTTFTYGAITGSLSVVASATPSAALTYQWYSNTTNSTSGGTLIGGANTDSLTIPTALTAGSYYYYCEITALGATTVRSSVARVNVNPTITASVTQSPNPLKAGVPGTITVTYTLTGGTYASSVSGFGVTNLPAGMTAAAPVRGASGTVATVTVTGTPTSVRATVSAAASVAASQVQNAPNAISVTNATLDISMIKGDGAAVSGPPTAQSVGVNSITVNALTNAGGTGQSVHYAISQTGGLAGAALEDLAWGTVRAFSGLDAETTYYVYARTADNTSYNAGPAQSAAITTASPFSIAVTAQGLDDLCAGQAVAGSVLYTLTGGTYAGAITPGNFAVSGLPAGLSAGPAVRTGDIVVTVPITGAPTTVNASAVTLTTPSSIPAANITGAILAVAPSGTVTAGPVKKTGVSASITFAPGAKTYTGGELDCATAAVSGITAGLNPLWTYTYAPAGAGASLGTNGKPLTAGTYNVTASYEDDYNTGTASGVFTVNKKELTVSLAVNNKPYDGLNTATYTGVPSLVGVAPSDTVNLTAGMPTFSSITVNNDILINFTAFSIGGADAANYTLTQPTGITANIIAGFTPVYNTHYTLSAPDGDDGWFRVGNFVITAPAGYLVSVSGTDAGPWQSSLTYTGETNAGSVTFYMRNAATFEISQPVTVSYKIDRTAPTGGIAVKSNGWTAFLNTITFGLFFKNTVDVTITAADTGSGVKTVKYVVSDTTAYLNPAQVRALEGWTEIESGGTFSLPANWKGVIYADFVDNAGNGLTISSDGIVVYTDSAQDTASIGFTKTSTTDVTADVTLNGNTIAKIMNGAATLAGGTDYTVLDGTITFKAAYLDGLAAGDYTLTVHYSPLGEAYVDDDGNDAPDTTTIALAVSKASQAPLAITDPGAKTYGDANFQLAATGGSSGGAVTYAFVSGSGSVTGGGMVTIAGAGSIVVKATMAGDGSYNPVTSGELTIAVNRAIPPVDWPAGLTATYGQVLSDISLDGFINTPAGTFTWTAPTDAVGTVGARAHNMIFAPDDDANYVAQANDVTVVVSATVITGVAITVTAPVTGKAPDSTANGTGNFSVGTVSWMPGDSPFKGSTQYTAEVTLTADANYTFTGMAEASINGNAAAADNNGTSVTLSYRFEATCPTGGIKRENIWWRQLLHIITFGIFWSDFQQVTILPDDPNVTAEYFIGPKGMTEAQLASAEWQPYGAPFRFHPPLFSAKVVYARLADGAGHTAIISK